MLVGIAKQVGARWPTFRVLMPVIAALGISTATFAVARRGAIYFDLRAMIAPLVTFLPGGTLTVAVIELAGGNMVAGASRLVSGSFQLLLLAFGIIAGSQLVGTLSDAQLVSAPSDLIGWWAPWLGVLIFGIGAHICFSAPPRSLLWLWLVLYTAWIGQLIGTLTFGGYVSGFTGALLMTPVAYLVERQLGGPPAIVTFLPAFWLLVPGSLSLVGLTELVGTKGSAGIDDFLGAVAAIAAIALGVLCGYPIYRSMIAFERRLTRPVRRRWPFGRGAGRSGGY
jgi:uncharacterized membrane protein YjjB (DUF3815 family)